jgi:DNA repair protein RadC
MAIRDWPADERPREKLLERGEEALTDAELLAIFLRTGVTGKSAVDLARELLGRALKEDIHHGDALISPAAVRRYLSLLLKDKPHEEFWAVFVDAQNRVTQAEMLFRGTLSQTSVYPREVVKRALAVNAAGIILAHNHPSGVAEPSQSDRLLTQALKQALALVDVRVLDHFVVAGANGVSFAEMGML